MINTLIKNIEIVDGTKAPRYRGDIAIEGDRIRDIGQLQGADAEKVIDGSKYAICPGFIDMHSHADYSLVFAPEAESLIHQGITTVVFGQCGVTPAPINELNRKDLLTMLSSLLPPETHNPLGEITTFGSFLEYLERSKTSLNIVPLVGHGTVRSAVMGYRSDRPNEDEMDLMQGLINEALDSGAWGVSTGLIYAPGSFSSTEELIETLKPMGRRGGMYFSHIRGEAGTLIEAVSEAIEIGRKIGAPVEISHFKAVSQVNWGKASQALELIDRARAEGLDVTADMYPYIAGSTGLESMLPSRLLVGGIPSLLERIADPVQRQEIIAQVKLSGGEITEQIEWDKVMICSAKNHPEYLGKMVSELAEADGKDPDEWVLDALLATGGDAGMIDFIFSEDNVRMQMQHPAMMFGTDGLGLAVSGPLAAGMPHPRSFGAYPRILGHYVREEHVITLEEACWKACGLPAQKLGLSDRGTILKGNKADLVIFDPATIIDRATFLEPHQYPSGIDYVFVNGEIVVEKNRQSSTRPGTVIRRSWK